MPRFDGTGPMGCGPGTGWGMGPCGGGMARRGLGRGFGGGMGGRRPWGYGAYSPTQFRATKKEEAEILTEEAELLEEDLKAIKSRLAELKNQG